VQYLPLETLITAGAVRLIAVRSGMGEAGGRVNFRSLEIYSLVMPDTASFPVIAFICKRRIPVDAK